MSLVDIEWTISPPQLNGWYWLNRNDDSAIVKIVPQRAFGGRLCAFVPMLREWIPVDELSGDVTPCRWAGPIPIPAEPKPTTLSAADGPE